MATQAISLKSYTEIKSRKKYTLAELEQFGEVLVMGGFPLSSRQILFSSNGVLEKIAIFNRSSDRKGYVLSSISPVERIS